MSSLNLHGACETRFLVFLDHLNTTEYSIHRRSSYRSKVRFIHNLTDFTKENHARSCRGDHFYTDVTHEKTEVMVLRTNLTLNIFT